MNRYNLPMCHKRICPIGNWHKPCLYANWDEKRRVHRCLVFAYMTGDNKVAIKNAKYILNKKYPKSTGEVLHECKTAQ